MFPVRDDNPQIMVPYVTYGIVLVNVLVWVFVQGLGNQASLAASVCSYGLIPAELLYPDGASLAAQGFCPPGESRGWLTAITSMFMHGGVGHLAGNMLYLWICGDNVEDRMGHFRYLLFYLICGILSGLSYVFSTLFFGQSKPAESNETKDGRSKNRRVEFKIQKL